MKQLPKAFCTRMESLLGENYSFFLQSYEEDPVKAFHVNETVISTEVFQKIFPFSISNIPYAENGFYYEDSLKLGNTAFYQSGMIYLQEPAAMVPVLAIDLSKDARVLDLCAAPGGKTSQLACKVPSGILVSNEINLSRSKVLLSHVERLGYRNVIVSNSTSSQLLENYPNTFDCILVDAPCSGEGMFRKDDIAVSEWSEERVTECACRSREILSDAVQMLKQGGFLIYSTCTFAKEENEDIVSFLLDSGNFELIDVLPKVKQNTVPGISYDFARRCYPHVTMGEGQFVALLKRVSENTLFIKKSQELRSMSKEEEKIVKDFMERYLDDFHIPILSYHQRIVAFPDPSFPVPSKGIVACGVLVGEITNGRLIPHHQFLKAYGSSFKNKVELLEDAENLQAYLRGEEISVETPDGWGVIVVSGVPLGGFKASRGKLKNHYPKGLRQK